MTADQLRYFITIVDTGSYMETALELNIAQSSVSKQIQALERELGVSLFNRQKRHAELTPEGMQLLPQVRVILEEISALTSSAEKLRLGYKKRITVITLPFIGYLGLYVPLSRFELEHESCFIDIIEMEELQLMQRLLNNKFDIALTYQYEQHLSNSKNQFFPIIEDEIVLIVHKDDPLAKLTYVNSEHLKKVPLLLMEPYTCVSKLCMNFFKAHNITPNIVLRGRAETIFGGVESGRGVALLTRKQTSSYLGENVVLVPIKPRIPTVIGAVISNISQEKTKVKELVDILVRDYS